MIKINDNSFFKLYACCVPVKGATRSIICDLQRNSFLYITNDVFDVLNRTFSLSEIDEEKNRASILTTLNYLEKKEIGFYTSEPENFPEIDFTLDDFPEIVKNSIIDFDKDSNHDLQSIINQLSDLQCSAVELRFFDLITQDVFMKYLSYLEKSTVRTLNILLKYSSWTTQKNIDKILLNNKRISIIIIYNSPMQLFEKPNLQSLICFTTENIQDVSCCGNISPYYFHSNLDFFKEALTSNTCLDKKICIDTRGYIKNCPSMDISFGHIKNTKLKDCIDNKNFKKLWKIKKDMIEICKDCEFRYICPDCRAFTNTNSLYSKPKKCSYDPYKNSWN